MQYMYVRVSFNGRTKEDLTVRSCDTRLVLVRRTVCTSRKLSERKADAAAILATTCCWLIVDSGDDNQHLANRCLASDANHDHESNIPTSMESVDTTFSTTTSWCPVVGERRRILLVSATSKANSTTSDRSITPATNLRCNFYY